ncbi:MAG: SCO family protein [Microthrixaceae bacterium]
MDTAIDARWSGVVKAARSLGVALGLVLALVPTACGDDSSSTTTTVEREMTGYTHEPTPSVSELQIPVVGMAEPVAVTADPGELRVVYFGYTSCPDVCPTTMSDVKRALAQLPAEQADRVGVVMVTVDPDRDVDDKLAAYVATFIPDGAASRITDPAQLQSVAGAFGARYSVETADDGEVEVSHTGDLYVVDDRGYIVLQWPFGTASDDLAADLAAMLADQQ